MRRPSVAQGALLGAITSLPVIALLYLGEQLAELPFLPFDLFDWLSRLMPGSVVAVFVDALVATTSRLQLGPTSSVAKLIEQLTALALAIAVSAMLGAVIAILLRSTAWSGGLAGLISGSALFLVTLAIELNRGQLRQPSPAVIWLAALLVAWGAMIGVWLDRARPRRTLQRRSEYATDRRSFLIKIVGGSLAVALVSSGLGWLLREQRQATGANQPLTESAPAVPEAPGAATRATPPAGQQAVAPAPGTRRDVTANDDFYTVDINLRPPVISQDTWQLEVKGRFTKSRDLTLADLRRYPATTVPITLSCISNPIGGDLIGNAYWTGLRLRDLLSDLELLPAATALYIESEDGFFETVTMLDMMDERTLLIYGMNGVTLPVEHGFPLRILIPNRYGMKQPKWIKSIEAVASPQDGYWVERGWSKEARPQIVSIIDAVDKSQIADSKVPLGGIAWAGDRGVRSVEIQVDDGEWRTATLLRRSALWPGCADATTGRSSPGDTSFACEQPTAAERCRSRGPPTRSPMVRQATMHGSRSSNALSEDTKAVAQLEAGADLAYTGRSCKEHHNETQIVEQAENPEMTKAPKYRGFSLQYGGEGRIRTCVELPPDGFTDRCH